MHEKEQRFCLEHQQHRFIFRIVVEMLMHAAGLDNHDVTGLPVDAAAVMDVIAAALQDKEHRAVEMAVLLPERTRAIGFNMGFDRLADGSRAGGDARFAVMLRAAFPRLVAKRKHARLLQQTAREFAVSPFQRAYEGALLLPALPHNRLLPVVPRSRRAFVLRFCGYVAQTSSSAPARQCVEQI